MTGRRPSVVVDSSAPPWAGHLGNDINAALAGLASDVQSAADAAKTAADDAETASSNAVTIDRLPAGTVIQTLSAFVGGIATTSSTSYVDVAGATVTIIPIYATSQIVVQVSGDGGITAGGAGINSEWVGRLVRNSTVLQNRSIGTVSTAGANLQGSAPVSFLYVDAPNTTSAVTYKVQHSSSTAAASATTAEICIVISEVK